MSKLDDLLRENLPKERSSKVAINGAHIFSLESFAQDYIDLFGLESDKERFIEAFKIVTGGVGSELYKINTLVSSSLLSLLTFYPLFSLKEYTNKNINIPNVGNFNSCIFEVRNKVVKMPSCVDVLLKDDKNNQWLFLESKFHEPIRDVVDSLEIGISYKSLYEELKNLLAESGIYVKAKRGKLYLQTYDSDTNDNRPKKYLYGIKQVISHLIGLTRGPMEYKSEQPGYPLGYYEVKDYKEITEKGIVYFGTILYSSPQNEVKDYISLYTQIFSGERGKTVLSAIKKWCGEDFVLSPERIKIIAPLKYQDVFKKENCSWLDKKVKDFYELGK